MRHIFGFLTVYILSLSIIWYLHIESASCIDMSLLGFFVGIGFAALFVAMICLYRLRRRNPYAKRHTDH